jgi:WD40 repeat protein
MLTHPSKIPLPEEARHQHNALITSLTYSEVFGLISADSLGEIYRWDLESGQVLARLSLDSSVQSVRASYDGQTLAIVESSWCDSGALANVQIVHSRSLDTIERFVLNDSAAIAVQIVESEGQSIEAEQQVRGWHVIDWQGNIKPLSALAHVAEQMIGTIDKSHVSSLVLAQQTLSRDQIGPAPLPKPNLEPKELRYVEP